MTSVKDKTAATRKFRRVQDAEPGPLSQLKRKLESLAAVHSELAKAKAALEQMRRNPLAQLPDNDDLSLDAAEARCKRLEEALPESRKTAEIAARVWAREVHLLASDPQSCVRLYCNGEPFNPLDDGKLELGAIAALLSSVTHAAINNRDAVREINRLLDHASFRRISEEMDMGNYHERAAKLYDRIRQESAETSGAYRKMLTAQDVANKASGNTAKADKDCLIDLHRLSEQAKAYEPLAKELLQHEPLGAQLLGIISFIENFRRFVEKAADELEVFGKKYASEAAVDAFKDATRKTCTRIEKTGLFANLLIILAGGIAGFIAAFILMFLDTNLALKNWFLQLTTASALCMYGLSMLFGRQYRKAVMEAIRRRLLSGARSFFNGKASPGDVFAFPKAGFEAVPTTRPKQTSAVTMGFWSSVWGSVIRRFETLSAIVRNAVESLDRKFVVVGKNILALAAITGVLLLVSWFGDTFAPDAKFSFVSHDAAGNPCVMQNGRVLFANAGSYFVASAETSGHAVHVTELRKPAIDLVSPAESTDKMPKCLNAGAAPDKLPAAVENAAKLISEGLRGMPARDNAAAPPLVMPMVIDNAAQPGNVDFVTNIVTEERLVSLPLIVLPLFPDPVSGLEENIYRADSNPGLTSKEEAYHFGQAHLVDPVSVSVNGNQESLIGRIASAVQACMQATATAYGGTPVPENAKLKLSVFGFASATGFSKEQNHTLAEGRRLAVIRKLREKLTSPLAEIDKEPRKLEALSGVPSDLGQYAADFQFGDYSGMEKELNRLMLLASGSTKPDDQALIRSVVIRIESDALQYCGKERSEQAARLP